MLQLQPPTPISPPPFSTFPYFFIPNLLTPKSS